MRWHEIHRQAGRPLGLALLAITGLVGFVLAVHGWSGRNGGLAPGTLTGASSSSVAKAGPPQPSRPAGSSGRAGPTAPAAASQAPGGSTAASPGALLRDQSYAQYAYRVWPGTPGPAAQAALTGLSVKVRGQGSGIVVTAGVSGQPGGAPRFFAHGTAVYVIEASLGDDSGNSDYSLGDDGLVITDAHGRILR